MILNYFDLSNLTEMTEFKKKNLDIKVLSPKAYNEYKEKIENEGGRVNTIRNTTLALYKDDEQNPEYLEIQGYKFKLKKEKSKVAKCYIPVGEFEFVRVESWSMLAIILFILLVGIISAFIFLIPKNPTVSDTPKDPLQIADANDITDHNETNNATSQASAYTEFPGYVHLHLTEEQPYVYLTNPKGNTVYMVYTIYNGEEIIYETDAIEPGKEIETNLREILEPGNYILKFVQSTYDITTQATCNGTNQEVDIIIE